ncbi:metallopeptidase TldD-related protein [Candidatus Chlorohelix sp.]|uniref:metallopeptidase TldD-related protein n=1 Tax=Candidatus Chlorohelix sp. TaxID=3139201 RepID=UPI00303932C3
MLPENLPVNIPYSDYADQLVELLRKAEMGAYANVPKIKGWRFDASEGRSVTLSIVDNKLGGVYGPATARDSLGGGLYLIWEDEMRSLASIDRSAIPEFGERLAEWRASAYSDERAPDILEPQPTPDIAMFDPAIMNIVDGDITELFSALKQGETELRGSGVEFLDAGASASLSMRYLRNSKGIDLTYPSTMYSYSFYADSLYGNGYGKRKIPPVGELERIIEDVKVTTKHLKREAEFKPNPDGCRIILSPGVGATFMGSYIAGNLAGSAVSNRQAAYKLEDFKEQKQVLREDISLFIDGLRPFEPTASRATGEGIAGGQSYLIQHGKLFAPSLDLKYAGITGFAPTPGGGLYVLVDDEKKAFKQMVKEMEYGLLVYSVLGMHTQDTTNGRFSLSAPRSLVVENGEIKGNVKATISGNFFESIIADDTAFSWEPFEDSPAIELTCSVLVE